MKQSTNQLTSQSDLDQYNLVRENSNLTHENMLFSANRFGDKKIEIGLYSNQSGQERIAQQSIGNYVKQFKNDSKNDRLSILLCNGNVSTNQDQSGKSYQELTGDSHWTTLHLRKDQEGEIHAFYSDSLSHDNNDKKTIPTSVLQALDSSGIESDNINKIRCERQPNLHKCGDHALFNALAMNQKDELLTSNKVKDNILLVDESSLESISVNKISVDQFYQPHRQALAQEFNVRVANYQPTQQKSSQQNQKLNSYAGTDEEEASFIQMAVDKSLKEKSLSDTLRDQYSQRSQGPEGEGIRQSPQSSEDFLPQQISPITELRDNLNRYNQLKNIYDIKDEESMIQRAIDLSLIEQQNLELLKKFQIQIQPSVDDIKGQKDEYSQNLVDNISSPLVASNLEKFLPLLETIQRDPNKINDHHIQYQFENKMFEAQGTTRAQHSLEISGMSNMRSSINQLESSIEKSQSPSEKTIQDILTAKYLDNFCDGVKDYLGIDQAQKFSNYPTSNQQESPEISTLRKLNNPQNLDKVMPFLRDLHKNPHLLKDAMFQIRVEDNLTSPTVQNFRFSPEIGRQVRGISNSLSQSRSDGSVLSLSSLVKQGSRGSDSRSEGTGAGAGR
jgi:hypothetical protein